MIHGNFAQTNRCISHNILNFILRNFQLKSILNFVPYSRNQWKIETCYIPHAAHRSTAAAALYAVPLMTLLVLGSTAALECWRHAYMLYCIMYK